MLGGGRQTAPGQATRHEAPAGGCEHVAAFERRAPSVVQYVPAAGKENVAQCGDKARILQNDGLEIRPSERRPQPPATEAKPRLLHHVAMAATTSARLHLKVLSQRMKMLLAARAAARAATTEERRRMATSKLAMVVLPTEL